MFSRNAESLWAKMGAAEPTRDFKVRLNVYIHPEVCTDISVYLSVPLLIRTTTGLMHTE